LLYMCFLPSLVSSIGLVGKTSFKPGPWKQHAGLRAWRRRDRGGGRRGRGSLCVGDVLVSFSWFFLSVFCCGLCDSKGVCVDGWSVELCCFDRGFRKGVGGSIRGIRCNRRIYTPSPVIQKGEDPSNRDSYT
jgi:hypothetical protein